MINPSIFQFNLLLKIYIINPLIFKYDPSLKRQSLLLEIEFLIVKINPKI